MNFDEKTRKLTSESGYIHAIDDSLYTDYPIYLGKYDNPSNYEEGNEEGFIKWHEEQEKVQDTNNKIETEEESEMNDITQLSK